MSDPSQSKSGRVIGAAAQRVRTSSIFRRDTRLKSAREVIGWWEARRVGFNLIVGTVGIITCIIDLTIAAGSNIFFHSDFGLPGSPLLSIFGTILYAILANVCFTGGWVAELVVRHIRPEEADGFAKTTFALGLTFSVLLTLTPGILLGVIGFFLLVGHLLHLVHS
jgi:hypothetical protein